jgi:phytoene synthase
VYAFCRHVDDAVDEVADPTVLAAVLEDLRRQVNARRFDQPWGAAFLHTVEQYEIPWSYFQDLLTGVAMDQGCVRLQTWEELERYCYHVASVVGLMMTHIFLKPTPEILQYAGHLGTAMQLTNILRDVAEDWERDRIYLPEEEMLQFGVTEAQIADARLDASMREFFRFQIDRARRYYQLSEVGIRALPQDGCQITVWMMREIYAAILEEIEKADLNVFRGRVRTSTWRKCQLAVKAWRNCHQSA